MRKLDSQRLKGITALVETMVATMSLDSDVVKEILTQGERTLANEERRLALEERRMAYDEKELKVKIAIAKLEKADKAKKAKKAEKAMAETKTT